MGLLSQTAQELTERFTRMIVHVVTFGNPKPAVMQLLGNSPTAPVKKKECSTLVKGSSYCRNSTMTRSMKQTEPFIRYSRVGRCSVKPMRRCLLGNLHHYSHWHCPMIPLETLDRSSRKSRAAGGSLGYSQLFFLQYLNLSKFATLRSVPMTFRTCLVLRVWLIK